MFRSNVELRNSLAAALLLLGASSVVAVLAACATGAPAEATLQRASATLADSAGNNVGTVQLAQLASGPLRLVVAARGLTPGAHGIHFHAVGSCVAASAPPFSSAGGHFNPAGRRHGLESPEGPHAGDLANLQVDAAGVAASTFTTDRVTLTPGPSSLLDADGSAIVIHAGPDDQKTDPAGNSGARIAWGVVKAG